MNVGDCNGGADAIGGRVYDGECARCRGGAAPDMLSTARTPSLGCCCTSISTLVLLRDRKSGLERAEDVEEAEDIDESDELDD